MSSVVTVVKPIASLPANLTQEQLAAMLDVLEYGLSSHTIDKDHNQCGGIGKYQPGKPICSNRGKVSLANRRLSAWLH